MMPSTALPAITGQTTINSYGQPDSSPNTLTHGDRIEGNWRRPG
jgi:hypothetical protein